MDFDDDDLPAGYGSVWTKLIESVQTYRIRTVLGGTRSDPEGAAAKLKAREKTEKWKEQHRKAAREYARRKRAAKKAGKP